MKDLTYLTAMLPDLERRAKADGIPLRTLVRAHLDQLDREDERQKRQQLLARYEADIASVEANLREEGELPSLRDFLQRRQAQRASLLEQLASECEATK